MVKGNLSRMEAIVSRVREPMWRGNLLLAAAILGLSLACYTSTFVALAQRWNSDANYSHGYLVPLVSLYLALHGKDGKGLPFGATICGGAVLGTGLLALGFLLRYGTLIVASLILESCSLLLVLGGLILLLGGWPWWRRLWAPLLFLFFMVPWPSWMYSALAFPLQLFVSQVSAVALQLFGIPVLHEGNLIHLPGQTMHVAEACSGLRQMTAFLAIGTCAAMLMERPVWYRVMLLASSIPIAVLINVLRVTGTGLMLQYGFDEWTRGWLHTAEGLVMVGLGLALLLLETALIDWLLVDDEGRPIQGTARGRPLAPARAAT